MKKKVLAVVLAVVLALGCVSLSACGDKNKKNPPHTHEYGTAWKVTPNNIGTFAIAAKRKTPLITSSARLIKRTLINIGKNARSAIMKRQRLIIF